LPGSALHLYSDIEQIRHTPGPLLLEGGWHFSFLGGQEAIRAKLEAYSHQELNVPMFKERVHLNQVTSLGLDLFGRHEMEFEFCDVDERFPAALRYRQERFGRYISSARFNEKWSSPEFILRLSDLCRSTRHLSGALLEIGCWEGRSTVALAHACYPDVLLAVDTWEGNKDEHPEHSTVQLARCRDVFRQFSLNIDALTERNIQPVRQDCHAFLAQWQCPLRFAYIDASHDYLSTKRLIQALRPWLVPGGILCGADICTATSDRLDLAGGVERAVCELLPNFEAAANLWWWIRPMGYS
jgi:hypothetical protein